MTEYPDPSYGTVADDCSTFNDLPYGGNLKDIKATDDHTVVFTFCNPDVAFLAQIAFQALAIDDAGYLIANAGAATGKGAFLDKPNGTGPYMLETGTRATGWTSSPTPTTGATAPLTPKLELQWSDQSAARLTALQAGTIDGMDNPGKGDIADHPGRLEPQVLLARRPQHLLPRHEQHVQAVGQPEGAPGHRAWASTARRSSTTTTRPARASRTSSRPTRSPYANEGDKWYDFDAAAAKTLLAEGLQEEGIDPADLAAQALLPRAVRGYLPDPPTIAQEIATQLQENLGITVTLDQQESGTFLDNNSAGKLDGLFMLGWGADFPDASNFLDYHFASGIRFGDLIPELSRRSRRATSPPIRRHARPPTPRPTTSSRRTSRP